MLCRYLVSMVQDNVQDPHSLTYIGVSCIYQVLDAYTCLPVHYIVRILAQANLVGRLHAVIKQLNSYARYQAARAVQSPSGTSPLGPGYSRGTVPLNPSEGEGAWGGAAAAAGGAQSGKSSPAVDKQVGFTIAVAAADEQSRSQRNGEGMGLHRRGASVDQRGTSVDQNGSASGPNSNGGFPGSSGGLSGSSVGQSKADWLLEKCVDLLLVLANGDLVVKASMCSKDNIQSLLDCTQRLPMPHLYKVMKALRWLSHDPSVLPAIKDAGTISQLVPFLAKDKEVLLGQQLQWEVLHALYNICKFNRRVHLEVAATAGLVPHLCRMTLEAAAVGGLGVAAVPSSEATTPGGAAAAAAARSDPLGGPLVLGVEQAAEGSRVAMRQFMVPMLIGLASTSSSTRAKLWASNGLDIFLQLLGESVSCKGIVEVASVEGDGEGMRPL